MAAVERVQGWERVQGGLLELVQAHASPLPSLPEAVHDKGGIAGKRISMAGTQHAEPAKAA